MPTTFRNVVLCHTNDFPDKKNDQIKNWVEYHGGTYSKEMNSDVTHLVASEKSWKRYHEIVKAARRQKTTHIVKLDWLEDSLSGPKRRPLDETQYSWEKRKIKPRPRARTKAVATRAREARTNSTSGQTAPHIDQADRTSDQEMAKVGYHLCQDPTGFFYSITLARHDPDDVGVEQYRLKFYESDACPCAYACHVVFANDRRRQYPTSAGTAHQVTLAPVGSTFGFAWSMFTKIFERKTKHGWTERLRAKGDPDETSNHTHDETSRSGERSRHPEGGPDVDGDADADVDKACFSYQVPEPGLPQGLVDLAVVLGGSVEVGNAPDPTETDEMLEEGQPSSGSSDVQGQFVAPAAVEHN